MIPHVNKSADADFEEVDLQYAKEKVTHVKWYHWLLLNRTLKVVLVLILVGILTPLLLYQYVFYTGVDHLSPDGFSLGSCLIARSSRLLCGVGNVSVQECHPQCCYDHKSNSCYHRFPSRFSYILDRHWTDEVALRPRIATVPYKQQPSLRRLHISIDEVSSTHLTLIFHNSEDIIARKLEDKEYDYQIESPEFNVIVNASDRTIFNTMRGPLIASENIWEIAFKLTDESMFGLGEIPIKAETVKVLYNHREGLSAIPLIYASINGSYHGLLIDSVHPTEVTFREENVIVVRSITNVGLKFHLFVGPKPVDIMNDVMKHIGFNNELEYWMLGVRFCSDSPENTDIGAFIQAANSENMPFESHCLKPIVFDNHCAPEQQAYINEGARLLKNAAKKFVPHVSPHIIYEEIETITETTPALESNEESSKSRRGFNCSYDILDYVSYMIQDSEGMYKGLVDSKTVLYPDYENATEMLQQLWVYTTDFDAVVLENSWPLDESDTYVNRTHLYLPYFSKNFETVFSHTPVWNATKSSGEKYLYVHNKYSNGFTKAFQNITSTPLGTSSQWMDGNVFINRQNIATSWTNLLRELVQAALGGISGHWLWASPVCGDTDNFDKQIHSSLCLKWYQAATFMPMIQIYSRDTARDPLSFTGSVRAHMMNALKHRLMLAPYFYTTLQQGPLLRPMFFQFPESETLKELTSQFSVGDDLLIVPNIHPGQSMVHVFMPPGEWYEIWSGLKLDAEEGEAVTMATMDADFLTLIRGGSIILLQKDVRLTADTTRAQSDFTATIALECHTRANLTKEIESQNVTECSATGSLYLGTNMTVHLQSDGVTLKVSSEGDLTPLCFANAAWSRFIRDINIYGLEDELNNYDHMTYVNVMIDLCFLGSVPEMEFRLVP